MVMQYLQRKRSTLLSLVPTFLTSLLMPYLNTISGKEMSIKLRTTAESEDDSQHINMQTKGLNGCLLTEIPKRNPFSFSKMLV